MKRKMITADSQCPSVQVFTAHVFFSSLVNPRVQFLQHTIFNPTVIFADHLWVWFFASVCPAPVHVDGSEAIDLRPKCHRSRRDVRRSAGPPVRRILRAAQADSGLCQAGDGTQRSWAKTPNIVMSRRSQAKAPKHKGFSSHDPQLVMKSF